MCLSFHPSARWNWYVRNWNTTRDLRETRSRRKIKQSALICFNLFLPVVNAFSKSVVLNDKIVSWKEIACKVSNLKGSCRRRVWLHKEHYLSVNEKIFLKFWVADIFYWEKINPYLLGQFFFWVFLLKTSTGKEIKPNLWPLSLPLKDMDFA